MQTRSLPEVPDKGFVGVAGIWCKIIIIMSLTVSDTGIGLKQGRKSCL
jgi:hypothetical protein